MVGVATESSGVACGAYLVSGLAAAAVILMATAARLVAATPAVPVPDGAGTAAGLATLDAEALRFHEAEARRRERALAAVADLLERRAWWMTAIGTLGLLVSAPVWLTPGRDGLLAGGCGTVALLLVTMAPLAGMALCMVAITGEWGPPVVAPPPPGHPDPVRALAARRLAAGLVGELVVRRRRAVTGLMAWLLTAEVLLLLGVTAIGVARW